MTNYTITKALKVVFSTLILVFVIRFGAKAQISQPNRVEIELESNDKWFYIIPAEDKGLFLVREGSTTPFRNADEIDVLFLDTDFNIVWETKLSIESKYTLRGYDYKSGRMNLLLTEGDYYPKQLVLIEFSYASSDFRTLSYTNPIPFVLNEFEMVEDGALIAGEVESRPIVLHLPRDKNRTRVLPGFFRSKSELLQIATKYSDDFFQVVTSEIGPSKKNRVIIRNFTAEGDPINEITLEEDELHLLDGKIASSELSNQLFTGTYSDKKSEYSKGFFFTNINQFELSPINYVAYADLDNFFNYMREKRKKRVKERIKRKRIKGRKVRLKYRMVINGMVELKDQIIVIGEAYYPKYSSTTTSRAYYSANNLYNSRSFYDPYSNRVFDGYQYTHAVIIGLDKRGNVIWDNSFEINDAVSFNLVNYVKIVPREDDIVLLYLYDHVIKTKIIEKGEVVSGKNEIDVRLLNENDEVRHKFEDYEGLEYWYNGNTFYAYGVQRIKNLRDRDIPLNRKVFFINKIVVEP